MEQRRHDMKLDHINITVSNLNDSLDWYRRVFGFEQVESGLYQGEPWAIIKNGDALLALYEARGRRVADDAELESKGLHGVARFGLRIVDEAKWSETVARESVNVTHEWRYPHSDRKSTRLNSSHSQISYAV